MQEYKIIRETSHDRIAKTLNEEAQSGWEPINVYSGAGQMHFALLRRAATRPEVVRKLLAMPLE